MKSGLFLTFAILVTAGSFADADAQPPGVRSLHARSMRAKADRAETAPDPAAASPTADQGIAITKELKDPFEPVNRLVWGANKAVANGALRPLAKGLDFLITPPVRDGAGNFTRNLYFPGRFINLALQGRWEGAGDETSRFLCNTTLGIAGVFDPATNKLDIPKADADFGQTLYTWGWEPETFLMLPGAGPSSSRDVAGRTGDALTRPMNYFSSAWAFHPAVAFVAYTEYADTFKIFTESETDSYAFVKQAWPFWRRNQVTGFQIENEPDAVPMETLQAILFSHQDSDFPGQSRTRSAKIPATGEKLKFTYWLQDERAPVVYIIPGLGAHRLNRSSLGLAELIYRSGFSVVSVSSAFHPEFIESASTTRLPSYAPVDVRDVRNALTAIDGQMQSMHPNRMTSRALLGYSMGAFHALLMASDDKPAGPSTIRFDRYVAINTPVRLFHGMSVLDQFYGAPLAWNADVRAAKIDLTFRKVAALALPENGPVTSLPFDTTESKFLIGLMYRNVLRDVIFTSQRIDNLGVLREPIKPLRRTALYEEIGEFSYGDYLEKFVIPYYRSKGVDLDSGSAFRNALDLRSYAAGLRANANVHLVMTRNDFLLAPGDLAWLQSIIPPRRITVFERGGHMGNLKEEAVQQSILDGLSD